MSDTAFSGTIIPLRLKLTQRARAHRIGQAHMVYVMSHYRAQEGVRPTGEPELTWIGEDDRGVELRIIAVPQEPDGPGRPVLLVIHCMPTWMERN